MLDQRTIFLNYRRQESSHVAGRLADRLIERFGEGCVFMDVDSITPGHDFGDAIERALRECAVLLALIGPTWVSVKGADGRRRLDDPDDLVVLEIQAALQRGIAVIPVLVDGARVPTRDDLPPALAPLARRQAAKLDHETFRADCLSLVQHVARIFEAPDPRQVPASSEHAEPDNVSADAPRDPRSGRTRPSPQATGRSRRFHVLLWAAAPVSIVLMYFLAMAWSTSSNYGKILAKLPTDATSNCRTNVATFAWYRMWHDSSILARAYCVNSVYDYWDDPESAANVSGKAFEDQQGTCVEPPGGQSGNRQVTRWSTDGRSGWMQCDKVGGYFISWSIDGVPLAATFSSDGDTSREAYNKLLQRAIAVRDATI